MDILQYKNNDTFNEKQKAKMEAEIAAQTETSEKLKEELIEKTKKVHDLEEKVRTAPTTNRLLMYDFSDY